MSYHLLPHNPNFLNSVDDIKIELDGKTLLPKISRTLALYLNKIKKEIEEYEDIWDTYKKYTNPYEYIHTIIPMTKMSVCKLKPLSRSFYKMIEITNLLYLLENYSEKPLQSFHLAEGPGGFIEALVFLREKQCLDQSKEDKYYGMTLIDEDNCNIPGWKKSKTFLAQHSNVILESGKTKTGDLLDIQNLQYCSEKYKGQMDIITADGGFDFSLYFNQQEIISTKLILAQIFFALSMQKYQGHFILKVFDNFTQANIDILYLLNLLYRSVHIIKPNTSRYANSERYVVCKHFKITDTKTLISHFIKLFPYLHEKDNIKRILQIPIPYFFLNKLAETNAIIGQQQIENIFNTINIMQHDNQEKIETLKKQGLQKCIQWCQKNYLPCNKTIPQGNIFLGNK